MGRTQEDVMKEWNNSPRRVTVASFYMDETEVRNIDWLEYLTWLGRVFVDYPEVYRKALLSRSIPKGITRYPGVA